MVFCYQYQAIHKIIVLQGQLHIVQQVSDQLQLHKFGCYYPRQDTVLLNRAVCNVYDAIWQNNLDSFSIISPKRMGNHVRKDAVSKKINITSQTSIKKKQFTEVGDMNECKTALEIMSRNKNTIEASLAFHNNVEKMKKALLNFCA